jgi:hypothetical protein
MGGVSPIGTSVGTAPVDGLDWDLWIGYNGATKVFSFVAPQEPLNRFNSDIKQFFNYVANTQGFPAETQYLLSESAPITLVSVGGFVFPFFLNSGSCSASLSSLDGEVPGEYAETTKTKQQKRKRKRKQPTLE